jgi:glycosyltransferase involved in cell wall biosynthesis
VLINFISNIPREEFSGGFSAVNRAMWEALREIGEVHYVGPIRPPMAPLTKYTSKLLRVAGFAGSFPAYSDSCLRQIAKEVHDNLSPNADLDFFTGLTPWVHCPCDRRRMAWTDCSFQDYVRVYHRNSRFKAKDIERIATAESTFAQKCKTVMITSEWAIARAATHWGCHRDTLCNIGIFGNEEGSGEPKQQPGTYLLFASTNFQAKGGHLALEVLRSLRHQRPDLQLVIIGDAPRAIASDNPGVRCLGYLSKSKPLEHEQYRDALSKAFCLILPTSADMAPLTPLEAAAYGTPMIAFNAFALPELVVNGRTGILLDPSSSAQAIANTVDQLMDDPFRYKKMREDTRRMFVERFSKEAFQQRVIQQILNRLD